MPEFPTFLRDMAMKDCINPQTIDGAVIGIEDRQRRLVVLEPMTEGFSYRKVTIEGGIPVECDEYEMQQDQPVQRRITTFRSINGRIIPLISELDAHGAATQHTGLLLSHDPRQQSERDAIDDATNKRWEAAFANQPSPRTEISSLAPREHQAAFASTLALAQRYIQTLPLDVQGAFRASRSLTD